MTDFQIRKNTCWCRLKTPHFRISEEYVLVSFENSTLPDIGRYETDSDGSGAFYPGDDDASYASFGIFVNAWMPLPEVYRREE